MVQKIWKCQSEFFFSIKTLTHFEVRKSVYHFINGVFTMHFVVPGSHIYSSIGHFFFSNHWNYSSYKTLYIWTGALDGRENLMILGIIFNSAWKHMLWPLIWTVSLKWFRWGGDGSDEGSQDMASIRNKENYPSIISKYSLLYRALWTVLV